MSSTPKLQISIRKGTCTVVNCRERLLLSPPDQTEHPLPSGNLTAWVRDRTNQMLSLSSPRTIAERGVMTGNLAFYLNDRFDRKQDVGDLDFGITVLRGAIPETHRTM